MEVVKITPRGYCYGVVDAIVLARKAALDPDTPRPIYVIGQIVHNRHVVAELAKLDIITLDGPSRLSLLQGIERGTVIFTAHGVSPAVREEAKRRNLNVIDATCPDVEVTHELIRNKAADGYKIIYIGRKGHPEPEGAMGEAPEHVYLVQNVEEARQLELEADKIAITTQTTLSQWDTAATINALKERFPHAEVYNEICLATQVRQEAAVAAAKDVDVVIVVGDVRSNNSNRLVQVVQDYGGKPAYLVNGPEEIQLEWLRGYRKVGVTSGSSTPTRVTNKVIEFLEQVDESMIESATVK